MAQNKEQRKDNRSTRLVSFLRNCCILWFRFYLVDFVFLARVLLLSKCDILTHTHTRKPSVHLAFTHSKRTSSEQEEEHPQILAPFFADSINEGTNESLFRQRM